MNNIYDFYNIYECPKPHDFGMFTLNHKNTYSEYIHREGILKLEKFFPRQSNDMFDEEKNIINILGMCHGYNISYIYTSFSEEEKECFLKYHNIDASNKNKLDIVDILRDILYQVFKDIISEITKLVKYTRDNILNIYDQSIKKYMCPNLQKFIYSDKLVDRHISHIQNAREFRKSQLISKKEIGDSDIRLYMTENIDNYYLLTKYLHSNKLIKIPVNDRIIDLFSILMSENTCTTLSCEWSNMIFNLEIEYNIKFGDVELKNVNNIKNRLLNLVNKLFG